MTTPLASIEAEALLLSPEERVALADRLLASLAVEHEVEDAWSMEINRRVAEVEAGRMTVAPIEDALARARRSIQ
ncbi:MAG: hypothetical protein RLZZ618_497 [Pseudomonadota bacterium]|jgi:putative addiction module component (TIGR02574 family)